MEFKKLQKIIAEVLWYWRYGNISRNEFCDDLVLIRWNFFRFLWELNRNSIYQ